MKRKSRLVLLVSMILCVFSLLLMISPGVTHPKSMIQLSMRFAQEPTPENRMAVEQAQGKARQKQTALGVTAVGLLIFAILYGWHQQRCNGG